MLDVHAPHQSVHTWKDFLIHMSAICLGLLLAIGLEQGVELAHHRHEIAEAREALRAEREDSRRLFAQQIVYFRRETAALENNLDVLLYLERHPGASPDQLPGVLTWHYEADPFPESAWVTAQQAGVTALMSRTEVRQYSTLYAQFHLINARLSDYQIAVVEAERYSVQASDPTHLAPSVLADEIELTKTALLKHLEHGVLLVNLAAIYPDFSSRLRLADLQTIVHFPDIYPSSAAVPLARTVQRIDAAGKAADWFPQAPSSGQPSTPPKP
jgi:hypothetical protein